jgi:hypothetical protein
MGGKGSNHATGGKTHPVMLAAADSSAERAAKKAAAAKRSGRKKDKRHKKKEKEVGSMIKGYIEGLEDAIESVANTATSIIFPDDLKSIEDYSFAETMTESRRRDDQYSSAEESVEVAVVTTEHERMKMAQQQPDIATFKMVKKGRPYAVRKLVKQLAKEEKKRQKAERALQEAEEQMWKTKWKLYNLADKFGLLCGNCNATDEEDDIVSYNDDSISFTSSYSEERR